MSAAETGPSGAALTVPGIELTEFLAPLNDERPMGVDLEQEPGALFTQFETLVESCEQQEDRRSRRQAALSTLERGRTLLRKSKDLTIVTLLTRSLLVAHGFAGLYLGLRLLRAFHEQLWPDFFPGPLVQGATDAAAERAVLSRRRRPLLRLNEPLCRSVLRVPLTPPLDDAEPDYSFYRWKVAHEADASVSAERLQDAARRQPSAHFQQMQTSLIACIEECTALNGLASQLYHRVELGDDDEEFVPPDFYGLRATLSSCAELVEQHLGREFGPEKESPGGPVAGGSPPSGPIDPLTVLRGPRSYAIQSREHALACLTRCARFLFQREPLSPIPYLIARAVRWGGMTSIRDWLDELTAELGGPSEHLLRELGLGLDKEPTESASSAAENKHGALRGLFRWVSGEGRLAPADDEAGAPTLTSRAEAMALVQDATRYLYEQEPLSPLPHHLQRCLLLTRTETPMKWLADLLPKGDDKTLEHFRKTLGFLKNQEPGETN